MRDFAFEYDSLRINWNSAILMKTYLFVAPYQLLLITAFARSLDLDDSLSIPKQI